MSMTYRGRVLGGIAALALIGAQAGSAFAQQRMASPHDLITKISAMYHWATPRLEPRSTNPATYSLAIFQRGKPISLADRVGATLLNLYVSELKGQPAYFLTTYNLSTNGSPVWQYIYFPGSRKLTRFHFISPRSVSTTIWYITTTGIAQAAKTGHWPKAASGGE